MTGKRKRETLEELLDRPWCYYCERDFDDQQVLQTHQREMHFHCEYCSRRLNTASGLTVHTDQVHKHKVTRIRNAIEGRESPDIEIFGVRRDKPWGKRTVGIPEELVQEHRQSIIDGYYRLQAEHRTRTGNPLPGTVKHDPSKKGAREETPAEIKARLQAKMAAKKAAKEAAARGEQSSQTPENQTPAESKASPPAAFPHMQTDVHVASAMNHLPPTPFQPTIPFQHEIATFQPQPPMMANSPPNMSNGYPYGYPPSYPAANNYGTGYYNPPMPTMPYTQVPRTSTSPNNVNATHLPMPSAPGLPQRPSFDAPALSKNEMAAYHGQGMQHARGLYSSAATAPPAAKANLHAQGTQHAFGESTARPGGTNLPTQDTQHASGASTAVSPPPPPAREPTPPPPPEWNHLIEITRDKAAAQGLSYDKLRARDMRDGSEKTIYEVVQAEMKGKSGGHLVWLTHKGGPTYEEVKRQVIPLEPVGLRIDANATPTEITIAE